MPASPYAHRRERAIEAMRPAGGVMLVPAAPTAVRNNDVEHDYRQASDVFYLTGFDEPHSMLVLRTEEPHCVLFVQAKDPDREVWDGPRAGVEGAKERFGAEQAFDIKELDKELPKLLHTERLYYPLAGGAQLDETVRRAIAAVRLKHRQQGVPYPTQLIDSGTVLHRMRLVKEPGELELMRQAIAITGDAHQAAMAAAKPGMFEYELEAIINQIFRSRGSERPAYGAIVGSGPNATVLHHRRNDRELKDGELLLIDAGCELGYYASDITRTFPISGTFSPPQREIYELVLRAQLASIDAVQPGATLDQVHEASVKTIAEGLVQLGLLEGPVEKAIEDASYKKFYMHKTSHYLGMDVHDVGPYYEHGEARPLEAGVVITVEPGIYIAENAEVPDAYRGIGVRIEDDVLVTPEGREVLSPGIPKSVEDVERACA